VAQNIFRRVSGRAGPTAPSPPVMCSARRHMHIRPPQGRAYQRGPKFSKIPPKPLPAPVCEETPRCPPESRTPPSTTCTRAPVALTGAGAVRMTGGSHPLPAPLVTGEAAGPGEKRLGVGTQIQIRSWVRALGGGVESQICPRGARLLLIPSLSGRLSLSVSFPFPSQGQARLPLPRPGEPPPPPNSPSIRRRRARFLPGFAPPRADLTAPLGVSAGIHHEGSQIQGRRQGRCKVRTTPPSLFVLRSYSRTRRDVRWPAIHVRFRCVATTPF
jgi:hypothetical protein